MSNLEMKKQLEAMPERDRKIWELHRKATNALGYAAQNAEQGNENAQYKYEKQADAASDELWETLCSPDSPSGEQAGELRKRLAELEAEKLRFYHADGTYETLARPEDVIARRIECAKSLAFTERLRDALDIAVWRDRPQFPGNPYCVLCGAGQSWAREHGHQPNCALAAPPAPAPTPTSEAYPRPWSVEHPDMLISTADGGAFEVDTDEATIHLIVRAVNSYASPAPTDERLREALQDARPQLLYILKAYGCPCGARPEDLARFPHVIGCGIERLLAGTEKESK